MIYTNLKALTKVTDQIDMTDQDQVGEWRRLVSVYFEALYNPPQYVIGVGAITYAEEMLVKAQLNVTGE